MLGKISQYLQEVTYINNYIIFTIPNVSTCKILSESYSKLNHENIETKNKLYSLSRDMLVESFDSALIVLAVWTRY